MHLPCPDCGGTDSLSKCELATHCFRCFLTTYLDTGYKIYHYDDGTYTPYKED